MVRKHKKVPSRISHREKQNEITVPRMATMKGQTPPRADRDAGQPKCSHAARKRVNCTTPLENWLGDPLNAVCRDACSVTPQLCAWVPTRQARARICTKRWGRKVPGGSVITQSGNNPLVNGGVFTERENDKPSRQTAPRLNLTNAMLKHEKPEKKHTQCMIPCV